MTKLGTGMRGGDNFTLKRREFLPPVHQSDKVLASLWVLLLHAQSHTKVLSDSGRVYSFLIESLDPSSEISGRPARHLKTLKDQHVIFLLPS